jgi:hypothetical protein
LRLTQRLGLRSLAEWSARRGIAARIIMASRARPARSAAITAFVMGVVWVALEFMLRGGQGSVTLDTTVIVGLGVAGAVLGLSTRARVSTAGEIATSTEMTEIMLFVMFLLPAAMLIVYGVALIASAGVVALSWVALLAGVVIASLLQFAIYVAVVGIPKLFGRVGLPTAVVFVVLVSGVAYRFTGNVLDAWNFAFPRWAYSLREYIQDWTFVVSALRAFLAPLDHGALISMLTSMLLGSALALVASLGIRRLRRQLMRSVQLRPYLPMGAAPLPDNVPLLHRSLILPATVYTFIAWTIVLVARVL